nr:hypothetical protein [Agrobacterium rosae]
MAAVVPKPAGRLLFWISRFVQACEAVFDCRSNFQFNGSGRDAMGRRDLPMWLALNACGKNDCSTPFRQFVHDFQQPRQCVARHQDGFGIGSVIIDIQELVNLMRMEAAAVSRSAVVDSKIFDKAAEVGDGSDKGHRFALGKPDPCLLRQILAIFSGSGASGQVA